MGIVSSKPSATNLADRPSAGNRMSLTGMSRENEFPKSNVMVLRSSRTYCSPSGSLAPIRSLMMSTVSWGAKGPAIRRPGSSGRTLLIRKTMVTIRNSVKMDSPSRRSVNLIKPLCSFRQSPIWPPVGASGEEAPTAVACVSRPVSPVRARDAPVRTRWRCRTRSYGRPGSCRSTAGRSAPRR